MAANQKRYSPFRSIASPQPRWRAWVGIGILSLGAAMLPMRAQADAYTATTVHQFGDGSVTHDGLNPTAPMILGPDGNFYGVTLQGGTLLNPGTSDPGGGVAFRMNPEGLITILHNFGDGSSPYDCRNPSGPLLLGQDGNFYGLSKGGSPNSPGDQGALYKMTPTGTVTVITRFSSSGTGLAPIGGLVQAANGTFYGTASAGGSSGLGLIFAFTPPVHIDIVKQLSVANGAAPSAGLVDGGDGSFYGTTTGGGDNNFGTIYKLTPPNTFVVLHSFTASEGRNSISPLIVGSDGNLYGTLVDGGPTGFGAVFKSTKTGTVTILHSFTETGVDGGLPYCGLVKNAAGLMFGAFSQGGANNSGGVYTMTTSGTYTTVLSFGASQYGANPEPWLNITPDGDLYGTGYGADTLSGFIYKLTPSGPGGAATHFVVVPRPLIFGGWEAGVPFGLDVLAEDAFGSTATGYTGTVHFASSDPLALLPSDSTLTSSFGTFNPSLYASGSVTATDTVTPSITGSASIVVNPVTLSVSAPNTVTAGTPFNFNVTAIDTVLHRTSSLYSETVAFSTNSPRSTLPSPTALSSGAGTFSATLTKAGSTSANFKIHVTNGNGVISGTSAAITVVPAAASGFAVTLPSVVQAGVPFTVTVTAADSFGNTATGYTGTVHFTSSDSAATLPANATLTNGVGTFSATLSTNDSQSITATDTNTAGIHGSGSTIVVGAVYLLIQAPAHVTHGAPFNITVTAIDRYSRPAIGYTGLIHFYSNAAGATLPANTTLTNGSGTFSVTLPNTGNFKVSAVDTVTASLHGTSATIISGP